ncbi:hypothetical protein CAPTEDRAFT_174427 [Capitella teleta]|uniref:Transmembrane protein 70 homolog, mitochondrial n=1 Tax=Capitella teleta TaxID=283909 RepID=R7U9L6_CAPTE|nr:hypothetical protein CAPTEDRAFT_174427 [Capitella teleta]|eukprot:ELU02689.1 hypothetical protein CAPTEDRAFT_174427 [Capitella teleta]
MLWRMASLRSLLPVGGSILRSCLRQQSLPLLRSTPVIATQKATLFEMKTEDFPARHPDRGTLVYAGTLSRMVKAAKIFSLGSSMVALGLQPFIVAQLDSLPRVLQFAVSGGVSFFILVTPVLLHFLTKRYVTSIYFNRDEEEFTAATYTVVLREKLHKFSVKDIEVPSSPMLLTTVTVKGTPLFFDPSYFIDQDAYNKLMKYDEPIDWEVPKKESE